ncbi:MAG: hypothetical protein ACRBN8_40100 [Nannocystales bacterium]
MGELVDDELDAPEPTTEAIVNAQVRPVLFVPQGASISGAEQAVLDAAMNDVRGWYTRELGRAGRDIRWADDYIVVKGEHTAAYYLAPDKMGDAVVEVETAIGDTVWESGHIEFILGVDFGGWAGGSGNGVGGYALLGLDPLINPGACAGEWWCDTTIWRGAAVHELGHTFTLGHSADPSIMGFHGEYESRFFFETATFPELSTVASMPYVREVQGRNWTWAECTRDVCPISMGHSTDGAWSGLGTVPQGTRMGVFVEDGDALVVSYPMADRDRRVQLVNRDDFRAVVLPHGPPPVTDLRSASRFCAQDSCNVYVKQNLADVGEQILGQVPCGTEMGVFVTSADWAVVSYPMEDRARAVQVVPQQGGEWVDSAPAC